MKTHWLIICMLPLLTAADNQQSDQDKTVKDETALKRFLAAYEPEIPVLLNHYVKNRKITITRSTFNRQGGQTRKNQIEILSNDTCIRAKSFPIDDPAKRAPYDDVFGITKFPSFPHASRPLQKELPRWYVFRPDAKYEVGGNPNKDELMITHIGPGGPITDAWRCPGAAWALLPLTLAYRLPSDDLLQEDVEVLNLSDCEWRGRRLTCLKYRNVASKNVVNGAYYFDAKHHWVLCGKEFQVVGDSCKYVDYFEYGPEQDGFVALSKFEQSHEFPDKIWLHDRFEFSDFAEAHPGPEEFTLAHLGLSEPIAPTDEPFPPGFELRVILLAGGLFTATLIIATYACYRWKRRRLVASAIRPT